MAKIYILRHQANGYVVEFPFSASPSEEQVAAVAKLCFRRHGATHPKTGEPYWLKTEEIDLLGPSDIPDVPDTGAGLVSVAGVGEFKVEGKGHVKNPRG